MLDHPEQAISGAKAKDPKLEAMAEGDATRELWGECGPVRAAAMLSITPSSAWLQVLRNIDAGKCSAADGGVCVTSQHRAERPRRVGHDNLSVAPRVRQSAITPHYSCRRCPLSRAAPRAAEQGAPEAPRDRAEGAAAGDGGDAWRG